MPGGGLDSFSNLIVRERAEELSWRTSSTLLLALTTMWWLRGHRAARNPKIVVAHPADLNVFQRSLFSNAATSSGAAEDNCMISLPVLDLSEHCLGIQ